MIIIIALMLAGILVGFLLRNKKPLNISKLISLIIILLLFFLGVAVGNNPQIMNNLTTIGFDALFITLAALLGSCLMAWLVCTFFFLPKNDKTSHAATSNPEQPTRKHTKK